MSNHNLVTEAAPTLSKTKSLQELWGFDLPKDPLIDINNVKGCYEQLREELLELEEDVIDGYYNGKKQDVLLKDLLDVCIDMQVYIEQIIVRSGLADDFNHAYDKIYRNNASKVCDTRELAEDTVKMYAEKGLDTYIHCVDKYGVYVVKDSNTQKVMKPVGFVPVEL